MKKIYTCFTCGFPFAMEESEAPAECPACGSPKSQYLGTEVLRREESM